MFCLGNAAKYAISCAKVTAAGLIVLLNGVIMTIVSGALAAGGIVLAQRFSSRFGLLQSPNARSSHAKPTPTGGGVGIVVGGSVAALIVAVVPASWPLLLIVLASLAVAGLGLWDDVRPLAPAIRLAIQIAIVAATLGAAVPLPALGQQLGLPIALPVLFLLVGVAAVYWVNLYNFMDGIDGLAASQAVFLLAAPLGLALSGVPDVVGQPVFWWILALAAACLVFLAFNWQPAKIFMGDVGSTYLGFMIAVFALLTIAQGWLSIWQWLILVACFLTDGSMTLLRRGFRGEPVFQAHRRHAYQTLSRRLGSHQKVVLIVAAINVVALLPLAVVLNANPSLGPALTLLAYVPLIGLTLWAGAGRPEHA